MIQLEGFQLTRSSLVYRQSRSSSWLALVMSSRGVQRLHRAEEVMLHVQSTILKILKLVWCRSLQSGMPAQASSSSLNQDSKSRGPPPKAQMQL
ncbi:hypothetical protein TNCV_1125781 [Trichonephila clavipes]|nr:hypothetical protein TNCV_1125781 [Trichonephila clavipes]